jgi:HD-like signal output (HDOD) protein
MNPSLATLEAEALAIPHELGLPPCPQVLLEVGRELRRESPDAQKVAHLIAHDAISAAMILKTVNSPYYGLSNKARSVQQAIAYLGLNRTACLLAGLLLRNAFPSTSKAAMVRFWDASTELALTAALVAGKVGKIDRAEAHTFGLFRDIGSAVLICGFADYAAAAERDHCSTAAELTQMERSRYGADHPTIGAKLAREWQLPEEMSQAILCHHRAFLPVAQLPIASAASRLIALGALCDRIVDEFHGVQTDESIAYDHAAVVFELMPEDYAELAADAMAMLDDACGSAREQAAARY